MDAGEMHLVYCGAGSTKAKEIVHRSEKVLGGSEQSVRRAGARSLKKLSVKTFQWLGR